MKKRTYILLLLALLTAVALIYRNSVVDVVKKNMAKVIAFEYIPNQAVVLENTEAFAQRDSLYKAFRKNFRHHYQTLALAEFPDSSKMIVISDPPPHTEIDSLLQIFGKFNTFVETRKTRIGYDGFSLDIVLILANATRENIQTLHKKLSEYLFFSDYKPVFLSLQSNEKKRYFIEPSLDYQISLHEFNQWFLEDNEWFMEELDTAKAFPFKTFLLQKKYGVFFSRTPGFVAWSIPKNADISEQIKHIRRFTLDSDLILGAVADSATLVIIGRERETKLTELAPLNIETILLLASITEKELSQSLDINDLMAGKMPDGKDWCPTYLSKELENTEFGDLLTLTDILLKDWSESGTIKEVHYNYPEPGYYPFDRPLFRKLGVSELVYNWNTQDLMFAIDVDYEPLSQGGVSTIYTLNRTGALPVSYFNSQANSVSIGSSYENRAYNYFARLNNADLVRVVQYTALYQLFIDNGISYKGETYPAFPKNKPYLLQEPVTVFLKNIRDVPNEELERIADSVSVRNFELYQREQILQQIRNYEQQMDVRASHASPSIRPTEEIFADVKQRGKQDLIRIISECGTMLKKLSDDEFAGLCRYMAYPRGPVRANLRVRPTQIRTVSQMANHLGKPNFVFFGVDLADVKNYFSNSVDSKGIAEQVRNDGNEFGIRYLKTPSLIITEHDLLTTGGHNISSKISRVNRMTGYKKSVNDSKEIPRQARDDAKGGDDGRVGAGSARPTETDGAKMPVRARHASPSVRPRTNVISDANRKRGL